MEILAFYAGLAFVYALPKYALFLIILLFILTLKKKIIVIFLASIGFALLHHHLSLDKNMPIEKVITKARVTGSIYSMPNINEKRTQFQFLARELNGRSINAIFLLSCYQHCPNFKAGQGWQFDVKLKRPHNFANPGSFDYQSMLKARHIYWVGYLKNGSAKLIYEPKKTENMLAIRENLAKKLNDLILDKKVLGVFEALTLGITSHLSKTEWDLFRRTGTTHLMVISGAHIGLIAGFSYFLIYFLWSLSAGLCLYSPAPKVAGFVSLIVALIYTLLAGFGAPAKRALISVFFMALSPVFGRRFTLWQAWRYAIFIILFFEPHSVLLPGFYLSFIAVAILILTNQLFTTTGLKKNLSLQIACLIGLLPLSLYWFSYGALNGILANLIAIPLVSFILVPLSLLSLLVIQILQNASLLLPIEKAIKILFHYLHWVDSFAEFNLNFSYASLLYPLALLFSLFILFFLPIKNFRLPALLLLYLGFYPNIPKEKLGEASIDVLDVGQGLSVIVHTANHHLVYDTGAKFYRGSDMANLVIIPYLQTLGIKSLDKIIISHPDLDHRGGLFSLEKKYAVNELIVDDVNYYHRGKSCHDYPAWVWDGIHFQFLPLKKGLSKNNRSCVLRVENHDMAVLLTGDIEKEAEKELIERYPEKLKANFLLIPHHGSKTSSSEPFIAKVKPDYALISSGFDNRYHFPHLPVVNLLAKYKIKTYNTADCGMISFQIMKNKINRPSCFN